jgi:hypothetical protein
MRITVAVATAPSASDIPELSKDPGLEPGLEEAPEDA